MKARYKGIKSQYIQDNCPSLSEKEIALFYERIEAIRSLPIWKPPKLTPLALWRKAIERHGS